MSSKSTSIILSYTVSKVGPF